MSSCSFEQERRAYIRHRPHGYVAQSQETMASAQVLHIFRTNHDKPDCSFYCLTRAYTYRSQLEWTDCKRMENTGYTQTQLHTAERLFWFHVQSVCVSRCRSWVDSRRQTEINLRGPLPRRQFLSSIIGKSACDWQPFRASKPARLDIAAPLSL